MSHLIKKGGGLFALAIGCLILGISMDVSDATAQEGVIMATDYQSSGGMKQRRAQRKQARDCCPEQCEPWWWHKSSVFGEFMYLHVTDADVAHAQQQNGVGGAGTVPYGVIGTLDPDHEPGFRAGFSIACSNCASIVGSYSYYESRAIDVLNPPDITGGGGAVGSLVHYPEASLTASTGPVDATYDVDFQLADIAYRAIWKASSCYAINWSVGARYGHLEQDFSQNGVFSGGSAGTIDTLTNVDFDGGGLLFGIDGERRIGCGGWSIFGRLGVSPMSGTFQADYTMNNSTTDVLLAYSVWKDDRVVTLMDYEAGLAWTSKCKKWRLSAGYTAAYWFNAVTTAEFINTVQADDYDNAEDTIVFEGLTARIARRW